MYKTQKVASSNSLLKLMNYQTDLMVLTSWVSLRMTVKSKDPHKERHNIFLFMGLSKGSLFL